MTAKSKKPEVKDIPLTDAQVVKLDLLATQSAAAQKRVNEYLGGVLDAKGISGGWDVLGIENKVLQLKKKEGVGDGVIQSR